MIRIYVGRDLDGYLTYNLNFVSLVTYLYGIHTRSHQELDSP